MAAHFCTNGESFRPWEDGRPSACFFAVSSSALPAILFASVAIASIIRWRRQRGYNIISNETEMIGSDDIIVRDSTLVQVKCVLVTCIIASLTTAFALAFKRTAGSVPVYLPLSFGVSVATGLAVAVITVVEHGYIKAPRSTWANAVYHFVAAATMLPLAFIGSSPETVVVGNGVGISLLVAFCLHIVSVPVCVWSSTKDVHLNRYGVHDPPEDHASFWSRMTMSWLNPLLTKGNRQPLELDDVWDIRQSDKTGEVVPKFDQVKMLRRAHGKTSLLGDLFSLTKHGLFVQALFAFVGSALEVSQPLLLNMVLIYISRRDDNDGGEAGSLDSIVYLYVTGLLVAPVVQSIADGQNYFNGRRIGINVRSALISAIYEKALRVSAAGAAQAAATTAGDDSDKSEGDNQKKKERTDDSRDEDDEEKRPLLGGTKSEQEASTTTGTKKSDSEDALGTVGQIANLMSVDTSRIIESLAYIHFVWTAPLAVLFCCGMLYRYLGWASLAGLVCMIGAMPVNALCAARIARCQKHLMDMKDNRISAMSELLSGIRVIKMHVWEADFEKKVTAARARELVALRTFNYSFAVINTTWYATPAMVSMITFVARYFISSEPLTATDAFTALALFNALQFPLNVIPMTVNDILMSLVSINRIESFLACDEVEPLPEPDRNVALGEIIAANASCAYTRSVAPGDEILKDVTLRCAPGSLTTVVGATGAGKSSLLSAFIGEMKILRGSITKRGRVAYVSQQAWIQNATVRTNILFGSAYNEDRYARVVFACALTTDIEALEAGDLTEIGEKGINLSGGQKQRISLARAVYADSDIYILDDCLSAVDAHVGRHIFQHCIEGILRGKTRVLVTHQVALCLPSSDSVAFMHDGRIEFFGSFEQLNNTPEVLSRVFSESQSVSELPTRDGRDEMEATAHRMEHGIVSGMKHVPALPTAAVPAGKLLDVELSATPDGNGGLSEAAVAAEIERARRCIRKEHVTHTLIDKEDRAKGSIRLGTYLAYVRSSGGWIPFSIFLIAYAAGHVAGVLQSNWLRMWIDAQQPPSSAVGDVLSTAGAVAACNVSALYVGVGAMLPQLAYGYSPRVCDSMWGSLVANNGSDASSSHGHSAAATRDLYVYIAISVGTILLVLGRSLLQAWISMKGAAAYHIRLLRAVLAAPVGWFDKTPLGRIINRFSSDVSEIDQNVAEAVGTCLNYALMAVSVVVVVATVTPVFLAGIVPVLLLNVLVARHYLRTSRELKRLDSITKSPVYALFSETLVGLSTIRAYGAQQRFVTEIGERVDTNHRVYFYLWVANRWLNMRIASLGALVSFGAGISSVLASSVDAGLAGLSLSYALGFSEAILWFIRYHAQMELEMNAVERAEEYIAIEKEPPAVVEGNRPPAQWPSQGTVVVDNLVVKYPGSDVQVLRGVSLNIAAREKIGIVGRTGAGKSTLAVCFFRFMEAASGRIVIDGMDISQMGLHDLRSRLCIIPQEPVLFKGTIRSNLNPFNKHTDAEISAVLARVGLEDKFGGDGGGATDPSSTSKGLDHVVTENGNNLSVGQRQLLCLARALLRRSSVLIMDEATANVDNTTDAFIQETIRSEFADCTVLCIAHRLKTVLDCDRIVVMDQGSVAECGTPDELMARQNGHFWRLCKDSDDDDILARLA